MKKKKIFLICLFLLAVHAASSLAWTEDDYADFKTANESYRKKEFKQAIPLYEKLSTRYPDVWVFYYNLGNSLYRSGSLGKSILSYERAKLFEPREADVRYNLNYVRGLLEYRIEDKRNLSVRIAEQVLNFFTEKEIFFFFLLALFALLILWSTAFFLKRASFWEWQHKTIAVVLFISLIFVSAKYLQAVWIRDAIVLEKETPVLYGPSDGDQVAFRIVEGLKVYVIDKRDEWSRIVLINGGTGWVRNSQIAEVRP